MLRFIDECNKKINHTCKFILSIDAESFNKRNLKEIVHDFVRIKETDEFRIFEASKHEYLENGAKVIGKYEILNEEIKLV